MQPMIPDLNVLIAASRSDHVHHKRALDWLTQALAACEKGGDLQILPMVAVGFLRLVTHPKVFVNPTPIEDAIAFMDKLVGAPGVEMSDLGREWPALCQLCRANKLRANDISDAWIAAAVRIRGSRLVTFDRGFTRLLSKGEVTILS
jgi:toxin-antitoxin system PIN domain toxin